MWIKPEPGRLVRDPVTMEPVPAVGREVPDHDPYWLRKLRDRDVAKGTKPPKSRTESASAQAKVSPPADVSEEK